MSELEVLLVDDSTVMRTGLRALLGQDERITVVGEAGDGDECLARLAELQPDVVLLDVRMPKRDGLSVVAQAAAQAKVIMMTFTDDGPTIRRAMAEGAAGYLVHGSFDADSLAATVHSVAAGITAMSPLAQQAMQQPPAPAADRERHGLSRRQAEVMDLIAEGRSNGDIAKELFLAEKTVKNHINQIFSTLGARSRSEAMSLWLGSSRSSGHRARGTHLNLGPELGP